MPDPTPQDPVCCFCEKPYPADGVCEPCMRTSAKASGVVIPTPQDQDRARAYAIYCEAERVVHYACADEAFIDMWAERYADPDDHEVCNLGDHRKVELVDVAALAEQRERDAKIADGILEAMQSSYARLGEWATIYSGGFSEGARRVAAAIRRADEDS